MAIYFNGITWEKCFLDLWDFLLPSVPPVATGEKYNSALPVWDEYNVDIDVVHVAPTTGAGQEAI